ncbi:MAG: hypothetical protein AB7V42_08835 [Thermoleophilia bacterium]
MADDGVVLTCPLCGTVVSAGPEPRPGLCPGCGATYAGGGQSVHEGVAAALTRWGGDPSRAADVAGRLFAAEPAPAPEPTAAITSDRRDAFYLWWVFVRPGPAGPAAVLESLVTP